MNTGFNDRIGQTANQPDMCCRVGWRVQGFSEPDAAVAMFSGPGPLIHTALHSNAYS